MSRTLHDSLAADLAAFFSVNEFAREYTLSRGGYETSGVAAVTVNRQYQRPDGAGGFTTIDAVDFDLPASSYVIQGVETLPAQGDRFARDGRVWEAMNVNGRRCYEPDEDDLILRVHCKLVIDG